MPANCWEDESGRRLTARRLSRRRLIQIGALGTSGILTAAYLGCGSDEDEGAKVTSAPSASTPGAAESPVPGGSFTLGSSAAPSSMDPALFGGGGSDLVALYNLYDAPVIRDYTEEGEIVLLPSLGESWEWIDDTHLSMRFRRDVKFHDGTDFDAAAIKAYYDRILNPETASTRAADYKMLDHVEQFDDFTATYVLKFKNVLFVSALMGWGSSIPSPTAVARYGVDFQNHPVGTGAFAFKRQEPGALYEFEKNPNYWRPRQPLLDGFSIKIVPDKAVAAAALNAGDIDAASGAELDQKDIAAFQEDSRFNVYIGGASGLKQIWINKSRPPGDNVHLRKAVSLAINRDEFVDKYDGLAYVTTGPLPKRNPWNNPDEPDPEYNPDKAVEEMKLAGLEDGVTINIYSTTDPLDQSDAELLQAQWSKVGIKANFEFIALAVAAVKLNAGEFDFAYGSFGAALGDIDYVMETIFTTGGFFNGGATKDDRIDQLVNRGKNEEEDFKTRRATYWEVQKIINENFYQIWVVGIPDIVVMKKEIHGYIPRSEPGGPGYEQQFRGYWISR